MVFDASPSWSGFNYQGKVALFYALKLINAEPVGKDLSNYSLRLEATEDFEILRDANPISIHQVKAYNSSAYGQYADALLGIALELHKQPGVIGKIHTWKLINPKPGSQDLASSIRSDVSVILDEHKFQNGGRTIIGEAASSRANLPKRAAILRAALRGRTADQLSEILDAIVSGQSDALTRLNSYRYDDGNKFCDLNEINLMIKSEISIALTARNIPATHDQLEKAFHCFLGIMDSHIIRRHKNKQTNVRLPLTFREIVRALEHDHEDVGAEYLAYKFKERFVRLIDEYMADPEDYEEPAADGHCNLKELRNLILSLSPQDLWAHYRTFSPHLHLGNESNIDNALMTDLNGIRHVLVKIFHEIDSRRAAHNASRYSLTYRTTTAPHQHFLPTTILNIRATCTAKSIISNPCMSELLYEIENLIYSGNEPHTFSPTLLTHTEAPAADDADRRSKRDEVLNSITLVPIPLARDKLA